MKRRSVSLRQLSFLFSMPNVMAIFWRGLPNSGADPGICVRGPSPLPIRSSFFLLFFSPPSFPLHFLLLLCFSVPWFLVNCRLKIVFVLAMVTKDTTTWSIAKNAIRYLVRQSQHTIYCSVGPKSFSAVMTRQTTSGAEWKTPTAIQYINGASAGFFQFVEVVQKQRYFKFVISASHCHTASVIQFVILHYIKVIKNVLE